MKPQLKNEWSCPQCLGEAIPHCICIANQEAAASEWKERKGDRRTNDLPRVKYHDVRRGDGYGDSGTVTEFLHNNRIGKDRRKS